MKYIVEKSGYFMLRKIKGYSYGSALKHGIVNGDLDYTKLYDINGRSVMIYNIFMQLCNHTKGKKFRVEACGVNPMTPKRLKIPRGRLKRIIQAEQDLKNRTK